MGEAGGRRTLRGRALAVPLCDVRQVTFPQGGALSGGKKGGNSRADKALQGLAPPPKGSSHPPVRRLLGPSSCFDTTSHMSAVFCLLFKCNLETASHATGGRGGDQKEVHSQLQVRGGGGQWGARRETGYLEQPLGIHRSRP